MNPINRRSIAALVLAASWTATVAAQDYRFRVPKLQMHAVIRPDASAKVIYDITFTNMPGAHAIDIVDIGVPHENYSLSNVRATIGGQNLHNIRHSKYVKPGFEVHLGSGTIRPGATGTLHVEFIMPNMVYQDTTREDNASFRITPTWFGSQYVQGTTDIEIAVHLPKEIQRDEILHQGQEFSNVVETEEGFSAVWLMPQRRLTSAHMVALSFPRRALDRVVDVTKWQLLVKWFSESQGARIAAGVIALVLAALAYFRFTGGTGISLFVVLLIGGAVLFVFKPVAHLLSLPILATLVGANEYFLYKRKPTYLPPIAEVEGGGIKRGLTAPEAAVLLELPIARILGLVIFGLLKKGILQQIGADPLIVELHESFVTSKKKDVYNKDRAKHYRKAARTMGTSVRDYESSFLFLLEKNAGKPVADLNFAVPLKVLIKNSAAKMRNFDLSDTQDYYRSIVQRAVNQAKNVGDIRQIDKQADWIMLDDDYTTVFHDRSYIPTWYRPMGHEGVSDAASAGRAAAAPPGSEAIAGSTSLGDMGASFAGWTENTMGSLASAISPGSLNLTEPTGGFMDLSGADRVTGEFFQAVSEALESSGRGGGGGGGGCACACAGCACACACAGGGR